MILLGPSDAVELLSRRVRYQAVLLRDGSWFCVADLVEDNLRLQIEEVPGVEILPHPGRGHAVPAEILTRLLNAGVDVEPGDEAGDLCEKVARAYGMPSLLAPLD